MDKPIFIVGLPRTGSTLWHNIFAQNNALCRIGEMHYLSPVRKDFRYFLQKYIGDLKDDDNIKKMYDLLFSDEKKNGIPDGFWKFDLLSVPDKEKLKRILINKTIKSDRSIENIFKIIIEEYTKYYDKSRSCVKFPVYVNYIPKLINMYPESKIVHIIRDPRAIAISRKNDPNGTRKRVEKYPYLAFFIKGVMILFVVFQYIWASRLHISLQKYPNYKLFSYEELLSNPKGTIEDLCKHTEIDFKDEMLKPKKGQASSITKKKQEGFDKRCAVRWINHISSFENYIISFLTRRSMNRFNYDPKKYLQYNESN